MTKKLEKMYNFYPEKVAQLCHDLWHTIGVSLIKLLGAYLGA